MMTLRFGYALLFGVAMTLGCSAQAGEETRRIDGLEFDQIDVIGAATVEITQGETLQLTLRGDASDLDRKPFYLKGRRLIIGENGTLARDDFGDVKYRVVMPMLRELHVKGAGDVYVKPITLMPPHNDTPTTFGVEGSGNIKLYGLVGPQVELRIKGSGNIKVLKLDTQRVEMMVAGSGDMTVQNLQAKYAEFTVTGSGDIKVIEEGSVQTMEVNVVGSGDVEVREVGVEIVEVNVVGSGSIELGEVLTSIQGTILGSGDVRYDGNPDVDTVELGSGECRRRD